jgi:hypothetical protein
MSTDSEVSLLPAAPVSGAQQNLRSCYLAMIRGYTGRPTESFDKTRTAQKTHATIFLLLRVFVARERVYRAVA